MLANLTRYIHAPHRDPDEMEPALVEDYLLWGRPPEVPESDEEVTEFLWPMPG